MYQTLNMSHHPSKIFREKAVIEHPKRSFKSSITVVKHYLSQIIRYLIQQLVSLQHILCSPGYLKQTYILYCLQNVIFLNEFKV